MSCIVTAAIDPTGIEGLGESEDNAKCGGDEAAVGVGGEE